MAGIKFVPEASFGNVQYVNKKNTFQAKNRLLRLADKSVANLIKAKLTETTNLNRQYSFWHFLCSDAKAGGWMDLNL